MENLGGRLVKIGRASKMEEKEIREKGGKEIAIKVSLGKE